MSRRVEHLRPSLGDGERILWEGAPSSEVLDRSHERPQYAFAGLFVIGSFFVGSIIPLFALIGLAFGFYLIGGWRVWDAFVRARTWYTLTNRRACVGKDFGISIPVRSYPISKWSALEKLPEDSVLTVVFQVNTFQSINRFPTCYLRGKMDHRIGFELITDGEEVFELMTKLKRGEQL